jgi:hypothetical protein
MKKLFLILAFPIHLTWSDFKGKFIPHNGEIASINTSLNWEYEQTDTIVYNITAAAEFNSDMSYTGTTDPYILNHEQQHYNLAILFSRKANSLIRLKSLFSEKDFETFKARIETEWSATDSLYDAETDHSRNKEAQIRWNKFIKEQLKQPK